MLNWIEKHKWLSTIIFIILVSVFPILVNALSLCEAKHKVFGFQSPWLSFWGTYLAAVASSGMIIITAVSIHRNSEDNKKNREIQSNIIKYQTRLQWINHLKEAITYVCDALDESIINDFLKKFNPHSKTQDFQILCQNVDTKLTKATFAIETVLTGSNSDFSDTFLSEFRDRKMRYRHYIEDIVFILHIPDNFKNKSGINNNEYFRQLLEEYKNSCLRYSGPNPERIWEIAEKYDYDLIKNRVKILEELRSYMDSFLFVEGCKSFIVNEMEYAEQILTYGTEQTK